jgi:hypothetical protein
MTTIITARDGTATHMTDMDTERAMLAKEREKEREDIHPKARGKEPFHPKAREVFMQERAKEVDIMILNMTEVISMSAKEREKEALHMSAKERAKEVDL